MSQATVLVSTCMREAAGFAVAEAVAVGLPVVYVDVGGPSIIAPEGTSLAVQMGPRMERRFASAMSEIRAMEPRPSSAWSESRLTALVDALYAGNDASFWDCRR